MSRERTINIAINQLVTQAKAGDRDKVEVARGDLMIALAYIDLLEEQKQDAIWEAMGDDL